MKTLRTLLGMAFALALVAMPAQAQTPDSSMVTFQVDMSALVDSCQFLVEEDVVTLPGDFNTWNNKADTLSDDDGDLIYSITLELPQDSTYGYKFAVPGRTETGDDLWEDDPNRTYTVTADAEQTVDVATFQWAGNTNICGVETVMMDYTFEFSVDMSVAQTQGLFDPETDVVTVAGAPINAWTNTADTLSQSFTNPDVYSTLVEVDSVEVPQTMEFKFVVRSGESETWESVSNRMFDLTGEETDIDDTTPEIDVVVDPLGTGETPYFNNTSPDQVLSAPATVTYVVDLRPAFYHLADSSSLPASTGLTDINGLFINGPMAARTEADTLDQDWLGWTEGDLGGSDLRQLFDDGTNGDETAGDTLYTKTVTYPAGTARTVIGKMGVNGFDNEAGFGNDHSVSLEPGDQTIELIFGAIVKADGNVNDDLYDPYIQVVGSEATVVRRGGSEDSAVNNEDIGQPELISLSGNYPNPFRATTSFSFTIDRPQQVSVAVYDMLGRKVRTLVEGPRAADTHQVTFEAGELAGGMYIYRLETEDRVLTKKMILVK